jgi:ElaB/YqjD/DUF883 family membrane-anchored ribosome-binding protein
MSGRRTSELPAEPTGSWEPSGGGPGSSATDKTQETVDQAKEKATQAVDTARERAGEVAGQAAAKADVGIEKAAGGLDRAADMLREKAGGTGAGGGAMQSAATVAADRLDTAAQYLQGKDTDQLVAELEALVRRRPMESLLVAAGIGFVLSKALR